MRRRELILGLGSAVALPRSGRAQKDAVRTIGYLQLGSPAGREPQLAMLRGGLAEAGFVEGRNLQIEYRWANDRYEKLPELAADLVRRQVAAITAPNLNAALAARQATATIPIVFMMGDDPIKQGLVVSLNRPGGNATGVSMLAVGLVAKRLGLLRELVPKGNPIAVLVNPNNPNLDTQSAEVQDAARAVGQRIEILRAASEGEIEAAFAASAERGVGGIVVGADPFFFSRHQKIVAWAARHLMPAIYEWREVVEAGGLASYGANIRDLNRQLGLHTGKVLAGTNPAELPVVQPTKFEFVLNLKTAKALSLNVPPVLLVQADEVIE